MSNNFMNSTTLRQSQQMKECYTYKMLSFFSICCIVLFGCDKTNSQNNHISEKGYSYTEFHFEENLKGPIKEINLRSFLADENFSEIKSGQQYSWESDYNVIFDFNGASITTSYLNSSGESAGYRVQEFRDDGIRLMDSSANKYVVYKYNNDDYLIFEGNNYSYKGYEYSDDNLMQKFYIEDNDTMAIGNYFSVGDTIYEIILDQLDTLGIEVTIENELQLPLLVQNYDNEEYGESTETQYTPDGLYKSKEIWQIIEERVVTGMVITEFSDGDEVQTIEYDEDGSIEFEETVSYKYDDYHNWIEKRINYNDRKYFLITRKIDYY